MVKADDEDESAKWRAVQEYLLKTTPEGLRKALLEHEEKGQPQTAADLIFELGADLIEKKAE